MSEHRDNDNRNRGRRGENHQKRIGRPDNGPETKESSPATPPQRRQIILARHDQSIDDVTTQQSPEWKTLVRSRTDDSMSQSSHTPAAIEPRPTYSIQRHPGNEPPAALKTDSGTKLGGFAKMPHRMKLLDEYLYWCEDSQNILQDQTEFYTIGVLGLQGTGKSTLMSKLAGDSATLAEKDATFLSQTRDHCEQSLHRTEGIDIYVTPERLILLDCQPVLSTSILNLMIQDDYKYPPEYRSYENCIHMESLQLATFLLTVCNVVVVSLDWFIDINFIKLLQTAEMMKPPAPVPSPEQSSENEQQQYYPHIAFVLNKADKHYFTSDTIHTMQKQLANLMSKSALKYTGGFNMDHTVEYWTSLPSPNDVNLFLLPDYNDYQNNPHDYKGCPRYEYLLDLLRNQLTAMPHRLITHTTLTEKNWFHYAARTWDGIKKSTLLSDYNRLLSQSVQID